MNDAEVMAELRSNSPLNKARAVLSSAIGEAEQDGMQRKPPGPVEMRRKEFAAVRRILIAYGVTLTDTP